MTFAAPLSFAQEGLWFLDQLEGPSPVYNVVRADRLRGALDAAVLERSLRALVARHECLRTTFEAGEGGPVQLVHPVDDGFALTQLSIGEDELPARLRAEAARPFDLARGPLLRAVLFRLAADEHALLLVVHHIVSDGWSMGLLVRELGAVYRAGGDARALPVLPLRFVDHVQRQRAQPIPEASLAYWRQRLRGLEPLALPTDRLRPARGSSRGAVHRFTLPAELMAGVRELARGERATLFMVLLTAFDVLLARSSGQDDLAVGVPLAGRVRPELEGLFGYFINPVVVRADLSGAPSFRELLRRVRAATLEGLRHHEVPFNQLVAELSPERDLGRNPLFQVSFDAPGAEPPVDLGAALRVEPLPLDTGTAKFDLTLRVIDSGGEAHGELEYASELFDPATAARLGERFTRLVAAAVADPAQPVATLPWLDEAERRRILVEWNDTTRPFPRDLCLHQLLEAQARRTPEAVALVAEGRQLSYRELDARATRLAGRLRDLGVGPDARVALFVERGVEMMVALLGTLKAGGAYVPMDPIYPAARIATMLADCAPVAVLTLGHLAERLPATPAAILVVEERDDAPVDPPAVVVPGLTPDHLAYIIYTSGSTGVPKGVEIEHRSIVNYVCWMADELGLGPDDRLLQHTSLSFDGAGIELWPSLHAGGRLVLASPGLARDSSALVHALAEQAITVLNAVPSMMATLLSETELEAELAACAALRRVILGGEALERPLIREVHRVLPWAKVHNFYGPTEATIASTSYPVTDDREGPPAVPIGRPLANTRVYILDAQGQPLPVGVVGELHIGGVAVARGYHHRPELTAERFVPDPFGPAGGRLYRTGDLARWLPDGTIEYRGRNDHQVKIRGFRIELGEIETRLVAHPDVAGCAVVARPGRTGELRLVAYVVARGAMPTGMELRRHLSASLPDHMHPAQVVELPALPLLPSGKVDRKALPEPAAESTDASYVAPRSPLEEVLAAVWCEVLGLPGVGVHDHFFDLGGHSLAATRIAARVRVLLSVELPVATLFARPTIATLAEECARLATHGAAAPAAELVRVSRQERLAVSFSQRRMWLLQELEPDGVAYNVAEAHTIRGPLDRAALIEALQVVRRRHEAFVTTFTLDGDEPAAVLGALEGEPLEEHDLGVLPAADRHDAALQALQELVSRPFVLSRGPLHAFHLLRLADDDHLLVLVMHHVVSDEWSMAVLLGEVSSAYHALRAGQVPALRPLGFELADLAAWQRRSRGGDALDGQLAYWRERLAGLAPLNLPVDHHLSSPRSSRGAVIYTPLDDARIAALEKLSARHAATPYMTLLATFDVLLARWCGQTDVTIGSPIAGRTTVESEHVVGTLVNTLVLRTDVAGDPTFIELLAQVRATALAAYAHQEMPYDSLVEKLRGGRGLDAFPDVQVQFNVLNTPRRPFTLAGLACASVPIPRLSTQFDLSLVVDIAIRKRVSITYSTELFEPATAARLLEGFLFLLDQVLAHPEQTIGSYRLVTEADQRVLDGWNATAAAREPGRRVHDLLAEQAARSPDSPALTEPDRGGLSYAELDGRANSLARLLRARGLGRGALVGLCVERNLDMVVAQLAVLKAGAAYVPLDPAYPPPRLAHMASDARLAQLITDSSLVHVLGWPRERSVLLDVDAARIEAQPAIPLPADGERDARPEDPAYVIYTSGSTGKPKGVAVPHRAVVNFLASMAQVPGLGAGDRLVAVTTLSFDIAVLELLLPLTVGGEVILAGREQALDGRALRALLDETRATVMQATPTTWRLLLEAGWSGGPAFKALVGGEALPLDLAQALLAATGELWNMYGPTETTVWSTCWRVESPERGIRIGRPIDNTHVVILDERRQPCRIGAAGEIAIGGLGVALGYLHNPEQTAERFIPDRSTSDPGARLYRTGDRGRWRHDGLLEHQGRLDFQVKVRGHRIELGEIEANLAARADLQQAVVIVRQDQPGDVRLVAYVVPRGAAPSASELREGLRATLPDYMVPQHFVVLQAIPLTPNGKVDRLQLPAPDAGATVDTRRTVVAPRNEVEEILAGVWQRLLGVPQVSVNDNFYDLGGHSLLAVRAISELEARLGVRLEFRQVLFETLAQTAAAVARRAGEAPSVPAPGLLDRLLGKRRR